MKKIFLLSSIIFCAFSSFAKDGFKIDVTINDNNDTLVYLCNYYGNGKSVYRIDSCKLKPGTNKHTFTSTKNIKGGIYILLFSDKSLQFEFILNNNDNIGLTFSKNDVVNTAKFVNSPENTDFYEYQKFAVGLNKKGTALQEELAKAKSKKDTLAVEDKQIKLGKEIENYRIAYTEKNPKSFLATLFKALREPAMSDEIMAIKDTRVRDSLRFRTYKDHYWDFFDFKDDRIIYAPIYEAKLEQYYKMVMQTPDSCIKEADAIMKKAEGTEDIYKYSFWWQTRNFGLSKVMGMDEAYIYMIENYVMRDKCPWLDDSTKENYIKDHSRSKHNTLGKPAPEMVLMNRFDKESKLSTTVFSNDYTIIAFYDPTCHHCQKEIPQMDSVMRIVKKEQKLKIKFYAIQNAVEDVKWRAMIEKEKLTDDLWEHVYDPSKQNLGLYTSTYGVVANPMFFIVDSNGILVGKRLDHSNIGGLFEFLEKKKKEAKTK